MEILISLQTQPPNYSEAGSNASTLELSVSIWCGRPPDRETTTDTDLFDLAVLCDGVNRSPVSTCKFLLPPIHANALIDNIWPHQLSPFKVSIGRSEGFLTI